MLYRGRYVQSTMGGELGPQPSVCIVEILVLRESVFGAFTVYRVSIALYIHPHLLASEMVPAVASASI